jgi:parallel beta-helix repeat protein
MKRTPGIILALAIALIPFAPPAALANGPPIVVDDGSDCQNPDAATINGGVALAAPGSTIIICAGTYHESVVISKNDLTLRAHGAPGSVVLDGLAETLFAGFYIQNASGISIEGFTIERFHEAGILLDNGDGNTIRKNVTTGAHHDGIELRLGSSGNVIEHSLSIDNLAFNACGIQIRDAGSSGNLVRHNVSINNNWGIRVGIGATGNVVFDNLAMGNRAFGILNFAGANGTSIEGNRAFGNPTGIAVQQSSGVTVAVNHAFDNALDLSWDELGSNTFENNHCNTSVPAGLCAHTEGSGH